MECKSCNELIKQLDVYEKEIDQSQNALEESLQKINLLKTDNDQLKARLTAEEDSFQAEKILMKLYSMKAKQFSTSEASKKILELSQNFTSLETDFNRTKDLLVCRFADWFVATPKLQLIYVSFLECLVTLSPHLKSIFKSLFENFIPKQEKTSVYYSKAEVEPKLRFLWFLAEISNDLKLFYLVVDLCFKHDVLVKKEIIPFETLREVVGFIIDAKQEDEASNLTSLFSQAKSLVQIILSRPDVLRQKEGRFADMSECLACLQLLTSFLGEFYAINYIIPSCVEVSSTNLFLKAEVGKLLEFVKESMNEND
eukprot:maker-scaffold_27-snap-gene-0.33-mRNA-1 protein AED:0.00 eAED:0.00 QI:75/1/1/1/1/1/2/898/311